LNSRPIEYEAGVLIILQQLSVSTSQGELRSSAIQYTGLKFDIELDVLKNKQRLLMLKEKRKVFGAAIESG
jgi:hypothetical protein